MHISLYTEQYPVGCNMLKEFSNEDRNGCTYQLGLNPAGQLNVIAVRPYIANSAIYISIQY